MKIWLLILVSFGSAALADDFTTLCADRAAIERVYHAHRLGAKPPFEQAMPSETLERLVRLDVRKETVLRAHYGVVITPEMLAAEAGRINATTRAPEMLSKIKAALGDDREKFASAFAKPILVERELRQRFDNDDALHAVTRRHCETTRHKLLAARTNGASPVQLLALLKQSNSNAVTETIWHFGAPPTETNASTTDELEIKQRFGPEAQILSSPRPEAQRKFYFDELPGELQNVLRIQLRQSGDVSAVIEMPTGFFLYVTKVRTSEILSVATLTLAKRSYEQWLREQSGADQ